MISIIIPCYNQASFLDETLRSVYIQTHQDWECLIIDDGSTDDSKNIALKWCEIDTRFKYYFKENGGLSSARNYGLDKIKGDFIQFLDGDDLIRSDKLALQLLDTKKSKISISDYFPFDDATMQFVKSRYLTPFLNPKDFHREIILDWEFKKSIPCHAVLFNAKLIAINNLRFDESLENHEDWVFWVQLFHQADTIVNRKEQLAFYRVHGSSMTADFFKMRQGFLKAALSLKSHFEDRNQKTPKELVVKKYKQINRLGKTNPIFNLAKRTIRKVNSRIKNVK